MLVWKLNSSKFLYIHKMDWEMKQYTKINAKISASNITHNVWDTLPQFYMILNVVYVLLEYIVMLLLTDYVFYY